MNGDARCDIIRVGAEEMVVAKAKTSFIYLEEFIKSSHCTVGFMLKPDRLLLENRAAGSPPSLVIIISISSVASFYDK